MDKEKLLWIYRKMLDIRNFETRVIQLFQEDKLFGSVHTCIGQEASPAVFGELLTDDDYISTTHRGHGHCLGKGADIKRAMAELAGKDAGYCKGRGGSMHIADFSKGNLGANGIVGGGIPIVLGAAFSAKYRKTDQVAVAFFGDGAANEGTCHECMNMAALWKLPMLFVCENNGYALSTSFERGSATKTIGERAAGYNMPGLTADGNDVLAFYDIAKEAIDRARQGGGPTLLELKTHRWMGHWNGDPQHYRSKEEAEDYKAHCPIKRLGETLQKDWGCTKTQLDDMQKLSLAAVEEAVEYAMSCPEPSAQEALDSVFCASRLKV